MKSVQLRFSTTGHLLTTQSTIYCTLMHDVFPVKNQKTFHLVQRVIRDKCTLCYSQRLRKNRCAFHFSLAVGCSKYVIKRSFQSVGGWYIFVRLMCCLCQYCQHSRISLLQGMKCTQKCTHFRGFLFIFFTYIKEQSITIIKRKTHSDCTLSLPVLHAVKNDH